MVEPLHEHQRRRRPRLIAVRTAMIPPATAGENPVSESEEIPQTIPPAIV
jgi:hypothetical protein